MQYEVLTRSINEVLRECIARNYPTDYSRMRAMLEDLDHAATFEEFLPQHGATETLILSAAAMLKGSDRPTLSAVAARLRADGHEVTVDRLAYLFRFIPCDASGRPDMTRIDLSCEDPSEREH